MYILCLGEVVWLEVNLFFRIRCPLLFVCPLYGTSFALSSGLCGVVFGNCSVCLMDILSSHLRYELPVKKGSHVSINTGSCGFCRPLIELCDDLLVAGVLNKKSEVDLLLSMLDPLTFPTPEGEHFVAFYMCFLADSTVGSTVGSSMV